MPGAQTALADIERRNSLAARAARRVIHGFTDLATMRKNGPQLIAGGKGIYVFDENGTPYIEGASGMWCASLGFDEPELIEAAVRQFHELPYYHTLSYRTVGPAIELADRLAAKLPIEDARIHFALSGSEANDFLIKFVRAHFNGTGQPQRKKIISRINGYHGATHMAASLTGIPGNLKGFDVPLPGVIHVSEPSFYREGLPGESVGDFVTRLVEELEAVILHEGPDTIAAFIAEPVTGAGGVTLAPRGYYAKVQSILKRYGILFLADEVVTGFHRTGPFWGCETAGIRPDAMTMAKGMTSAYQPLAAIAVSPEIYAGMEAESTRNGYFGHGTTYSGHPVGCAVALKVLDLIESRSIARHVAKVSERFAARLEAFRDHPLVGDVRSVGLIGAVEFNPGKSDRARFDPVGAFGARVKQLAETTQRMICRALPGRDACAFAPPLIITEAEIDEMFDRFGRALDAATAEYATQTGARDL